MSSGIAEKTTTSQAITLFGTLQHKFMNVENSAYMILND